ncbi:MAG: sigma factor-like helix-turn-helix DNA-binding protein [Myxococcota bacterium]
MSSLLQAVSEGWGAAREQYPALPKDPGTFVDDLRVRGVTTLDATHLHDLALAWACASALPWALRVFEATVLPQAERAVRRIDGADAFVDEVLQRLRTRLLVREAEGAPRIASYGGRGPLAGWVSVAAVRVGLSVLRETRRDTARAEGLWADAVLFPSGVSADLQHLKDRYAPQLADALRRACAELPDRERAVLRMYFVENLNIDKIGVVYGVHRSTVARWIGRTKSGLVERMHAILHETAAVPLDELSSIDRLVQSQLEISLAGLLPD